MSENDDVRVYSILIESDYKDEDIPVLLDAIRQLRGVHSVMRQESDTPSPAALARAKSEIMQKLFSMLETG